MKHTLYILFALLTAAISINAQQTDTLNEHDTWFQYQKDDGFEAFLLDRVDSIVYSRFDLDSVLHDDVVVQEVWFQGQVQRFLIDTIDSISFYKPETQYCDEVYHLTAFHVPYTIGIDSLTLTFDPSIPSDRLPLVGQVVVSDVRTHPYERGFAGRVRQIDRTTEGIVLVCDRVSIVDIYKQLVAVGHVEATPDDEGPNQPGSTRHRVSVQDENYQLIKDKVIEFPLKVMTITDTISYSIDYTVNIGLLKKPVVKVYVNGRHGMKGESKLTTKDKEKEWDVWPDLLSWNFPIPGLEILTVSLKLGGFAYAGGNMELIGEVPLTMTHRLGFEWEDNQLTPIKKFDYKWGDPEVTLDVKGTLRAGVMMQLGINLISDQIVSANITGKIGPQLDADLVLSSDGVRDLSWYQALKDTKATLSLYTGLDAAFEVFGNDIEDVLNIKLKDPIEENWFKTERYLLPEFTTPQLVPYTSDYDGYSLTSIMTKPSRSTLLPVGVGIGMFDRGGNRIAEKWAGQWWTDDPKKPAKKVQYDLSTADPHQSHIFRPIVRLLGTTIDAYPEVEFTVPGKITLAENSVMMNEGTSKIIEITDGWGIYHNILNQDVVKVTIYGEPDGKHYLRLDALQAGEVTIDVDDVRTGKTVSVRVKVVDPNALIVNPYNVTVAEKQTADVTVKGGSGQYRVSTYDTDKIQVGVDGNIVHITALTPGEAIILVQDSQSDYFANIQVKVDPTPKSVYLAQNSINMTAGDTRTIEISGKNGQIEIYKEADFLNIISDTPDVATVRLTPGNTYYMLKVYALKEGVAHVTIEDTTTGDQSTMEVNVGPTSSSTYTVTDGDYTTYVVNGVPFKMINVEGGTYMMGRTPEQAVDYIDKNIHFLDLYIDRVRPSIDGYKLDVPAHEETVTDFSIGEKQVTWELYKAVMGEGNGKDDEPLAIAKSDIDKFITRLCEITKLPFRQPTEAEWEYAARGGKNSKGYKYPGTNDVTAASFGVPNELGISGLVGGYPEVCKDYWERGGTVMVREWGAQEPNHSIIPWISYRGRYYDYHDTGLRLALGGYVCFPDKWLEDEDWLTYFWPNNLKLPLWGERSLPIRGGYGEYEVTCKDPEIATAYTNGDKLVVESHSGGNTTITVTDKKNRSSVDVDVSIDHADFSIHSPGGGISIYEKIPIGIDNAIYIRESNGRFKFYVSDESGVKLSMTPDKDLSIKGLKFGKYHVAITDIGSRKTLEWDTEVIDTLGFDRDYIIMREGQTDSVIVTHSNGNIEYYDIFGRYCYDLEDNIIRIPPTAPGTYTITVWDRTLRDSCLFLDVNDTKTITVVVTPDLLKLEQQLKADLQKAADELSSIEQELSKKATEEQAPKLYEEYRQLKDFCAAIAAMIESITSEDDVAKCKDELKAITDKKEALRVKVENYQVSEAIDFADAAVKAICVAHWDTDGDGELSYYEAAAVTELGETFKENKQITSFDELKHFTGLKNISNLAFLNCRNLTSIILPNTIDSIGHLAFSYCSGLNTITIPNSVTFIGANAFDACSNMKEVYSYIEEPFAMDIHVFARLPEDATLYVPVGSRWKYGPLAGWRRIINIVEMGSGKLTPQELEYQKRHLKTELQTMSDELSKIAAELSRTFTEEQAPKLFEEYRQQKDACTTVSTKIDNISIKNDVASCRTEMKNISDKTDALRIKVGGNIEFTDAEVKRICVKNWDKNGDGELSYKEAAAITELGNAFKYNHKIASFDEFKYFKGLTSIEYQTFRDCINLTSVIIPNSVETIDNNAFVDCSGLESIYFPNSVTTIGHAAFANCSSLTSITIPYSVTGIGYQAFAYCSGLTNIVVDPDNSKFDSRENCNAIVDTDGFYTYLRVGCKNTYIHNSITCIGDVAFMGCIDLTSITIPNNITSIQKAAFSGCIGLTEIYSCIEDPFSLDTNCWSGVDKSIPLYVPAGTKAKYQTTEGWNEFTNIIEMGNETPDPTLIQFADAEVKRICVENWDTNGDGELSYDEAAAVKDLGKDFQWNRKITSFNELQYFTGLTGIGDDIFVYCESLTSVSIPNFMTWLGNRAFYHCSSLKSITIPSSIYYIGEMAFEGCGGLTSIVVEDGNTVYDSRENCNAIITTQDNELIAGCGNTTIPNSVTSIRGDVFHRCNDLKSIVIPASVTSIGIGYGVTCGCSNLTSIVVEKENTLFDSRDNCNAIINTETNELIAGCKNTIIPSTVASIGVNAFAECSGLTNITIPNSVTSIGGGSFHHCGFTSITIPNSVTTIGELAFMDCSALTEIFSYLEEPCSLGQGCWHNVDKSIPLYVPKGTKAKYQTTDGWKEFKNIVEMGGEIEPDKIAFADAAVKFVCLANWDIDDDGQISYDEAAAVTDLGESFHNNWQIKSFDELQYFTGLTSIGERAFSLCNSLTSVTIPNSVTSIGNSAFYDCSSLASVTIPNSVTSIGNSAFSGCSNLASVVIPESVTNIGEWAFNGTSLTSITIPSSVSRIETCAFQNCHSLTSVTIPNSVTRIGGYAFANCSGLATVTIPSSITTISDHAFAGCTGLTEIRSYIEKYIYVNPKCWIDVNKNIPLYVPAGTKAIYESNEGWNVFTNIVEMGDETPQDPSIIKFADTHVKAICVENWDTNGDGELSYDEAAGVTDLGQVFYSNKDITSFDELRYFTGLTSISEKAFSWSSLKTVTIPHNVVDIGQQSFGGCMGLTSITIPKSVKTIGNIAFYCNWLTSIVVEDGNTVYDSRDNCNAIIHTATNELVQGCANTIIPNSVTSIGTAAFWGCEKLESISIPSSVTTIGTGAFADCYSLTHISIPSSVTTIGVQAFQSTGFSSIDIPSSVTSIGKSAFTNCHLTSVTIPSSITSIEQGTFYYCESLASVTIPNSITSIGMNAFQFCSSLSSITSHIGIPRAIDNSVFSNLPEDVTLYVPAGTKAKYEATDGWKNFKNIVEMEYVTPDPNDPIIKFADAEVKRICVTNWDTNGDHELSYDEAAAVKDLGQVFKDNLNIISFDELQYFTGLTTISERALASCLELTNITLPNSVTSIDTYALFDNYYLTSIIIPNSVTYIGRYAFCFCRGLANIVIPNSVTTIDEWAFDGCTKLSSVTIPNSVTSIGESAFFGCSNLNEVYSYIEKPYRVGCWASVDNCTLYVPAGTKAKYQATEGWKEFKNIVEMGGDEPVPDEPNEKIEAMKKDLEMETMKCMEMLHALSYELEKKDPEGVARELRQDLEYCAMYIKEAEYRVSICKTEDDIKDAQSQIEKMRAQLDYLNYQIEKLELEEPLTVTTVEGVKLTLKIISETEKTAQVGDGEKAALSQSTTGSVTIPASAGDYQIVAIAKWAFDGCHGLEAIHIPASVTSLSNNFLGNCRNLTSLTVAADNPVYNSPANSNAIVKTDNQTLVAACNSTVLPEGIVTIGEYAFAYCDAMDYLNLQGVSTFHDYAFAYSNVRIIATGDINQIGFSLGAFNCSKVEMFYIRQTDGTVSMFCNGTMWRNAYAPGWAAPTFTTYTVPDEVHLGNQSFIVSKLGHSAFSNCTQLTEVTIPATITAIEGKYAFNKCTALHTITSHIKNPFVIDSELFVDEVYANATLYVPVGTKAKYEVTDGWKNFKNIVEMGK